MDRRKFLKWSAALGGMTALTGGGLLHCVGSRTAQPPLRERDVWTSCNVNCGGRCALRAHVVDGVVRAIDSEADTAGHAATACLRGRAMRHRLYAPDRLKYPMLRVGARGEGKFRRASWDEALDLLAARLREAIDTWGNESVYLNVGTGNWGAVLSNSCSSGAPTISRLMNCLGGHLRSYGTYSYAMLEAALPYTYGGAWVDGNPITDVAHSELAVFFGNNPATTRMGGLGVSHDLARALRRSGTRLIVIDPRHSDTAATFADEWIPIRPGTDAALVSALAHVLITENLVDHDFLATHTIGYDEDSMPDGVPAGQSYRSHILGLGPDRTAKTPGWAEAITGIPAERIVRLAREIGAAKPCYIAQGWSLQRQANGEQNCRAVCMLPILTGNVGIRGGNTGAREGFFTMPFAGFPTLDNPVAASIPCFMWTEAVRRGHEMTATTDGVRGVDKLPSDIRFIWNFAGNCLINQHSDANRTARILVDETKCRTIVVIDNVMTASARFADILLPGVTNLEEDDFALSDYATDIGYVIFARKAVEPLFESRSIYDICAAVAKRLGVGEAYTEGRDRAGWLAHLYEESRRLLPGLPERMDDAFDTGIFRMRDPEAPRVPYAAFRRDPVANPLDTPSGRIEIFSKRLWDLGKTWQLGPDERIPGLPEYVPAWEGVEDPLRRTYPLQLIGHHPRQRTHSTGDNVDWLRRIERQELWMNPADAALRGIAQGDMVRVFNARGAVLIPARVTPRIAPGVLSLPEGAWYAPAQDGADTGGCINVLTTQRPSPLAKGNPQHTNLVQVEKA
ncbi:anaerobic dimethyl sulfoxide reductase subunit A [Desulfobaculum xiamenense]|uniref:Anaerobic dimethyl sulfoxide reductase subunit A n=1 Tax=Desulfobaculum xiamenense TaxID=995050 RepID=A0A846QQ91_9BACT|nr:DMSO/selenate family reductase complex A subunit [Desulfobaculum xiamenense]NJB67565.1 anaerobic dimethyl sulfoxide reductase subunit A [Desulfobaculum xiamenense]